MANNSYNGNNNIKADGVQHQFTPEEVQEYIKCMNDVSYFCKTYVKVISLDHGLVPFELRGYQKNLVKQYSDNRFNIVLACRQSGKSVTSVAWLLHYIIFNPNKKVGILANKGATAREMLSRFTLMLENLPFFLQPGVRVLNKGNIVFSHNSEVIAAATSGSSIRGLSLNCITGDTKICLCINDNIFYDKIDNFINKSELIQKDMFHTVYKITNLINNKIYVGYHATNNLNDGYMGSGKLIKRAIEKYGISNFKKEILSVFDNKDDAEAEERCIVDKDFTLREDTYNLSEGGNILVLHGPNNGFYGKTHSEETKEKLREAKVGKHSGTGKKIIHNDGREFETIEIAISELEYDKELNDHAARLKLICDCGNNEMPIKFIDIDDQQKAEELYFKRLKMSEATPQMRKEKGKIVSEKLKGVKKTQKHCENISVGLKGLKKSTEHVNKINKNPEKIRKTAEKHRGTKRRDDSKLKMSLAKKGKSAKNKGKKYYINPENHDECGYFVPGEQPENWINKMKI
jgi:group I intron endonuclease